MPVTYAYEQQDDIYRQQISLRPIGLTQAGAATAVLTGLSIPVVTADPSPLSTAPSPTPPAGTALLVFSLASNKLFIWKAGSSAWLASAAFS